MPRGTSEAFVRGDGAVTWQRSNWRAYLELAGMSVAHLGGGRRPACTLYVVEDHAWKGRIGRGDMATSAAFRLRLWGGQQQLLQGCAW